MTTPPAASPAGSTRTLKGKQPIRRVCAGFRRPFSFFRRRDATVVATVVLSIFLYPCLPPSARAVKKARKIGAMRRFDRAMCLVRGTFRFFTCARRLGFEQRFGLDDVLIKSAVCFWGGAISKRYDLHRGGGVSRLEIVAPIAHSNR